VYRWGSRKKGEDRQIPGHRSEQDLPVDLDTGLRPGEIRIIHHPPYKHCASLDAEEEIGVRYSTAPPDALVLCRRDRKGGQVKVSWACWMAFRRIRTKRALRATVSSGINYQTSARKT